MRQLKLTVITLTLQLLFVLNLCGQNDTVRWYRQDDKQILRTSTNPILEVHPVHGRNELVIVENYDSKGRLLSRGTTIDEKCLEGKYIEFDVDTKVQVIGNYLNCGLRNGYWAYVTANGDTLAKEQWSRGQFVKEIIKQKHNSIWAYRLLLNEMEYTDQEIDVNHRFRLKITLYFKNDLQKGRDHIIRCTIFRGAKLIDERNFRGSTDFNTFNHYGWCKKNNVRSGDRLGLSVYQSDNKERFVGFNNILVK